MFLRATPRKKDGKIHRYWSVVENRRLKDGRVVQRHVLYLGEINDAQRAAWCKSIAVLEEGQPRLRQMAIFPEQRTAPELSCAVVHVKLDAMRLRCPRQRGICWLGLTLWEDCGKTCNSTNFGATSWAARARAPNGYPCCRRWRCIV